MKIHECNIKTRKGIDTYKGCEIRNKTHLGNGVYECEVGNY